MTAEVIILAERRPARIPTATDRTEIERLRAYARRYISSGSLKAFLDDELDDMERLIVKHSMLVEFLDENGDTAGQEIIFID